MVDGEEMNKVILVSIVFGIYTIHKFVLFGAQLDVSQVTNICETSHLIILFYRS